MTRLILALAAAALLTAGAAAQKPLRSGPAVGQTLPGPFSPKHVNGPDAGEVACLV